MSERIQHLRTSVLAVGALLSLSLLAGCQQTQRDVAAHSQSLSLTAESLAQRQAQTRRFDTEDENTMLSAAAGVMQDLGFLIEETSSSAGLVVGSKERDAVEAGQVAGQLVLAALVAALGGYHDPIYERDQRIRISVATKPAGKSTVVRLTIQRVIWNNRNQLSRVESINDPLIYQEFFNRLAQSVFLEANQI